MPRRLSDQVVVVTGASSGVGRAIARAFGQAGAKVGLIARTRDVLEEAEREIAASGAEGLVLPLDVSDPKKVSASARAVVERFGRIDTWVNNAMVSVFSPVQRTTPDEYRRVVEVNYLGTVHGTLAALEQMRRQGEGVILQIGSALVYRSIPLQSAYCASKAAIRGFTDSLRCELFHEKSRIKVCMLQLPAVNTHQFAVVRTRLPRKPKPVPPIFQPEVIARAALHAALHPTREMWVSGSAVKAILGQRIIPGLLDRYLGRIGYDAQQTGEPVVRYRPDNVFAPVPGDRGETLHIGLFRGRIVEDVALREEQRPHRAGLVDARGNGRLRAALPQPRAKLRRVLLDRLGESLLRDEIEHHAASRHRQRIPRQRARLIDGPRRRHFLHHVLAAAEASHRKSAADHLAEAGQVGLDAVALLGPTARHPEAGHHLVEDEERPRRPRLFPQHL